MSLRHLLVILLPLALALPAASFPQDTPAVQPQETQDTSQTPPTAAQKRGAPRDSVYRFDAGSSSLREENGEQILEGRDGVRIVHGDATITAHRGIHYRLSRRSVLLGDVTIDQRDIHMTGKEGEYLGERDIAILRGDVTIRDRGILITCDEAEFYRTTERAWAKGNVVVVDSTTTLTADSLFYDRALDRSEAFGNVVIVDTKEGIRLRGGHGFYFRSIGKGVIDEAPRLIIDPESDEPATVVADTMVFSPDNRVARAKGRVKIIKGNTVTQCDSAVVIDEKKRVELYGNPLAKQGNVSMQGEKMILRYTDERINSIKIVGRSMIKEVPKDSLVVGRDSWVKGDSMVLFLRENALDSMRVSGGAESEYYPWSAERIEGNYAKGDSMFFLFENDSLTYVKMVGKAGGTYRHIKLNAGETGDSLRAGRDTSLTYIPFAEKAEKVEYAADTIQYYAKRRDLVLTHNAKVDYKGKTLIGKNITYSADLELLDATGKPLLIEGADKLYGVRMDYDLDVGAGLVHGGTTKFMDGYYNGETIAKVGDNILKVWNSSYTTCDLKVPHYHLTSDRMKVYLDDKIVTGPLVLYIGDTPLFALPFFAQNIRRGRRSGILRPEFEFGITSQKDRFIRNVGYYWATNDYTDFTFITDFNENRSFRFYIDNRYKLRYMFNGGLKFSWYRDLQDYSTEWTLTGDHSQTLGEKSSFNARIHFVSSDEAQKAVSNIDDVRDVVDRRIESTASYRKSWNAVGFSASARRTQVLNVENPQTVKVGAELPNLVLSIPSHSLYFGKKNEKSRASLTERVLSGIRFSPGLSGSRRTEERIGNWTETISANGTLGVSAPLRAGFVSVSPNFSVSDRYQRTSFEFWDRVRIDSTVTPPDTSIVGGRTVNTRNDVSMDTGVSANTNVYGTFAPRIGPLRGIRHTITPSVSYSYTPAIQDRESSWRVSVNIRNAIDLKVLDKPKKPAADEGSSDEGSSDEGSSMTAAPSLGDPRSGASAVQKSAAPGDSAGDGGAGKTEKEEEKVRKLSGVFLWSLGASYAPDQSRGEHRWSRISSLFNLRVLGTNISLNQSIDPYGFEVLNTSLTSSVSLRGTHPFGRATKLDERELNVAAIADSLESASAAQKLPSEEPAREDVKEPEVEKGLPWDLSLAFSYSNSKGAPDPSSTLNIGGGFTLTKGWRLTYRSNYDVIDREFLGDYFGVTRDLHCWEMSFGRQKLADEWEFYFKIFIKSHPEIYAEQGSRGLGGGSFTSPFSSY
jgi:lipopolysaccharide assembly outer membrane protein LptD (OstA)